MTLKPHILFYSNGLAIWHGFRDITHIKKWPIVEHFGRCDLFFFPMHFRAHTSYYSEIHRSLHSKVLSESRLWENLRIGHEPKFGWGLIKCLSFAKHAEGKFNVNVCQQLSKKCLLKDICIFSISIHIFISIHTNTGPVDTLERAYCFKNIYLYITQWAENTSLISRSIKTNIT